MPVEVDPSQVHSIEVDPSQVLMAASHAPSPLEEGELKPENTFLPKANKWLKDNHPKIYSAMESLLTAIPRGAEQMARGIARPGLSPAERVSDVIEGGATGVSPALLAVPGMGMSAVKKTAAGLVAAELARRGGSAGMEALGASPEASRATGDVLGLAAGVAVPNAPALGRKAISLATAPGNLNIVKGTGEVLAGGGTAIAGHPVIGTGIGMRGLGHIAEGIAERKATVAPPPPEIPTLWDDLAGGKGEYAKLSAAQQGQIQNIAQRIGAGSAPREPQAPKPYVPRDPSYYGVQPTPAQPVVAPPEPPVQAAAGVQAEPPIAQPEPVRPPLPPPLTREQLLKMPAKQAQAYIDAQAQAARALPAKAQTAAEAFKAAMDEGGNVTPIRETKSFPQETYEASARSEKATALAKLLHEHGIPLEDARLMEQPEWEQLAKAAKVKAPSEASQRLALLELQKLERQTRVAQVPDRARAAAQALDAEMSNQAHSAVANGTNGDILSQNGTSREGHADTVPAGEKVPEPVRASENLVPDAKTETSVRVPGEQRSYRANYEVRELGDIQTSHSGHNFQPNPKYELQNDRDYSQRENQGKVVNWSMSKQFDPTFHITDNPDATNGPIVIDSNGNALGGNGRGMILQRVYANNPEGAAAYRELLSKKAAQFGIDPESVKGMKQPVLVRRIADSEFEEPGASKQAGVTDFNKKGTAELRPSERAIADSRRVSQGTLDNIAARMEAHGPEAKLSDVLEGRGGTEVLNKLIDDGIISPQERAAYASGDALTPEGKSRISKLMLGRFFRDPAQLDSIPLTIRNKMERIAAPLAKVEGAGEWNLTPHIQQAMDILEDAKAHGAKTISDYIKQNGLFGDQAFSPEAVQIAKALKNVGAKKLAERVQQYAGDAHYATGGATLFGDAPKQVTSFVEAFGR